MGGGRDNGRRSGREDGMGGGGDRGRSEGKDEGVLAGLKEREGRVNGAESKKKCKCVRNKRELKVWREGRE